MNEYFFRLGLSAYDVEQLFYRGQQSAIIIRSERGLRIQLQPKHLVPFITKDGIHGRFCLKTGQNNKFISLNRV